MKLNSWWTWFNLLVQKFRKLIFDINAFNVWWDDKSWIIGDYFATRCLLSCQSWVLAAEKLLVHQDSLGEPVFSWLRSFWGLLFYEVLQGLLHVFSGHFQGPLQVFSGHFQGPLLQVRFDLKEPACQPCTTQQSTESRLSVWKDWCYNLWLLITCDYWSEEVNTSSANRQQREDEDPKSAKGGTCKNEHDLQGIYFSKVKIQFFLCSFTFTPFQSRAPTGMESREIGMKTKLVINFINSVTWFIGFIFFYNFRNDYPCVFLEGSEFWDGHTWTMLALAGSQLGTGGLATLATPSTSFSSFSSFSISYIPTISLGEPNTASFRILSQPARPLGHWNIIN